MQAKTQAPPPPSQKPHPFPTSPTFLTWSTPSPSPCWHLSLLWGPSHTPQPSWCPTACSDRPASRLSARWAARFPCVGPPIPWAAGGLHSCVQRLPWCTQWGQHRPPHSGHWRDNGEGRDMKSRSTLERTQLTHCTVQESRSQHWTLGARSGTL